MLLSCLVVSAQNRVTVRGIITDESGETVIGANVIVKGDPSTGTITDIDGNFELTVPSANTILVITYIGMTEKEVKVTPNQVMRITLAEDSQQLEEVVVVGFGQQKKASVVGAIAQTTSKTLERTGGVSSLGQALTGNLPGVVTMTSSGKPGEEDPEITIRGVSSWNGSEPLVLVDGIERPMNGVDINSVASISVLKDASATAVFGVRGANGVILITTKRGEEGKATINVNLSTTLKTYSKLPDMMDSYDALSLRNRVIENELGYSPASWSYYQPQETINKYRYPANLEEFERYPNVNWVDELLKDVATSYNANVNLSGGTRFVKYFASVDYAYEGDIYKQFDNNRGYKTGYGYNRINVRSNLDFSLTKTTDLKVNLSGSHGVKQASAGQYENLVWAAFYGVSPDAFRPKYSDGTFGFYYPNPTQASTNSMEDISVNGVAYTTTDRLNTDFTLRQDLSFWLKGLSVEAKLAFDNSFQEYNRGIDDVNDWEANPHKWIDPETGKEYTDVTVDGNNKFDYQNNIAWTTGPGSVDNRQTYRRLNYSAQINYANTFGKHTVGAMGNFSREQYAKGSEQPYYRENWVGRVTYDYANRYMFEYNIAYNGSEKFAKEYRFGLFNSGAIGWMVTEEPFMKNLDLKWLDLFKFRASYGQIGDDNIYGRWLYMDTWGYGGQFRQGLTGVNSSNSPYNWYFESQVGNPNLQWEVSTKLDVAADFALFGGALAGSVDYFQDKRTDILTRTRAVPSYYGTTAPVANLGKVESKGYEIELRWTKALNQDWRLWGNAAYTHAENKIIEADDPKLKPEYQKKANKPINQTTAYIDKGYYNNWDELYGSTAHDALDDSRIPGNYIILDYDADGIISSFDQVPYGYTGTPQNTLNAQVGVDYKGWSFFVQFYGVNNVTRYVGLSSLGGVKNTAFNEGSYWSKDDINADVPLPRWGTQPSTYTSGTRYLFDGSYLRLKYAELSYTFNMRSIGFNSMKLYVNGNNLFLWTKMPDDRESNTGGNSAYPTQRRFNIGLRLTL
ncbi:TonB-linked SusC/RagA family outer membrane protein [Parabacteroides sp. PFB2-12]|uniref:SusC/RagA family TonB-linked outer membrane protein n=1 Tax=unclassified Parabacteroides TaxID=2649774 RepID=UPI00247562C9|nr:MULTISPECIES: TonB-dependent receptor [unclassified Parabacteroides]MDH6344153.1 TonB-linked SusC/RagA family outer membrane protein [Parabacteroides sp. PM6-13]MDH6392022.1 TonB-linked SusC/RagA family outer membrane protein [Parabacteroides sp. PFB2-12]